MSTDEFTLRPTVIVRMLPDQLGVVTVDAGEDRGLVVFRNPREARKYQEHTGQYTAAEGFELVGMNHEAIAALLEVQGHRWVHMPEPWTGTGGVDTFTAENFIKMLEQSPMSPA